MVLGPHQQRYPMQKLTPEIIHAAIDGFEAQKQKIDVRKRLVNRSS
jgi:hypothetical protein